MKLSQKLLSYIPNISRDWVTVLAWISAAVILGILMIWQERRARSKGLSQLNQSTQSALPKSSFPALSALVPGFPKPQFDAHTFFKTAYYSPLTAEMEKNILTIAVENEPNNPSAFLARFVGVGGVAVMHDETWITIFKSQILMLQDMNQKNGLLPLTEAKTYYDQAVLAYPNMYAQYSFDQWIGYFKGQQLVIQHPTNMLEITWRGKDFLKYLTHWGRYPNMKIG